MKQVAGILMQSKDKFGKGSLLFKLNYINLYMDPM